MGLQKPLKPTTDFTKEMFPNQRSPHFIPTFEADWNGRGYTDLEELADRLKSYFGVSSAARVENGSYTGTGTAGEENPNALTFSFAPKLVIIQHAGDGTTYSAARAIFVKGAPYGQAVEKGGEACKVNFVDNYIEWYHANSSPSKATQLNSQGSPYAYIAIG